MQHGSYVLACTFCGLPVEPSRLATACGAWTNSYTLNPPCPSLACSALPCCTIIRWPLTHTLTPRPSLLLPPLRHGQRGPSVQATDVEHCRPPPSPLHHHLGATFHTSRHRCSSLSCCTHRRVGCRCRCCQLCRERYCQPPCAPPAYVHACTAPTRRMLRGPACAPGAAGAACAGRECRTEER